MRNIIKTYKLQSSDSSYLVMPLFHVHGLIGGMLSTLLSGGTAVIPLRFAASHFWNDFLKYGCTWYTAGMLYIKKRGYSQTLSQRQDQ